MLYPSSLSPQVPMQDHVCALARQHPQVVRMAILSVLVAVMDDLSRLEWASQMPLGYGTMAVIRLARFGVAALGISAHERPLTARHRRSSLEAARTNTPA